ncbi:hypothetical protein AB0K18_49560 [Nonomuraea sp. NPDC049421]|uniref:hypothetical protein n=1 Tax=Nonomuraea sp. NPDC049421 TaxID=3155275 RepID=UPI00342F5977
MTAMMGRPSPDDLSVYGSLLLRGVIAAAHGGTRQVITELLDKAAEAGSRLGQDGNHMWTAFGLDNVLCHRTHIALSQGDAGTAIETPCKNPHCSIMIRTCCTAWTRAAARR